MKLFKSKKPVSEENDGIDGERGVSSVNRGVGVQTKITNSVIAAGAVALTGFLLYQYYSNLLQENAGADKTEVTRTISTNLPPLRPPVFVPTPQPPVVPPPAPNIAPQAPLAANGQRQLSPAEIALQRRLKSGVFFNVASSNGGGGGNSAGASPAGEPPIGSGYVAAYDSAPPQQDALSRSLQPSRQVGAAAYMLADPSLMVTKGSVIPCTVVPAIDSTLAGIVTCIQSADVWSADGKVLLLERGTRWVGEQKTGMSQGQKRLGMLWTRGQTPNHVLIDVDSGTADELGRPGVDGEVETHFWDRFGSAILVSLVGDVGGFLTATQSSGSGNTAIAFPGTVTGAQTVMSDVIKETINIPPTLTKNQGAQISIYVARDLDFRGVYALEAQQ